MFKYQIWSWLKAGIMDSTENNSSEINEMGTPQGGVLSPLLMNIALHGMENYVTKNYGRDKIKVIRYADAFAVFGRTLKDVQEAEKLVKEFLEPVGLNLSMEKTCIGHSMEKKLGTSGPIGLDFFSFHFYNVKCSRHRGVKNTRGVTQPFRLITHPSRKAVANHKKVISKILVEYKGAPLGRVIERLSSRIKGWTWYHSVTQSTKMFSKMDNWIWHKLWAWAKRRYRGAENAKLKCFSVKGWNFGYINKDKTAIILDRDDQTKVRKFVKIKANASIYDGNLIYFAERLSFTNLRIKSLRNLIVKQKYSCSHCGFLTMLLNCIMFWIKMAIARRKFVLFTDTVTIKFIQLIKNFFFFFSNVKKLLPGSSRMKEDFHVRFWTRGVRLVTVPRLNHYHILEL
uniref:Reverse transcriptase domain-containing protein n=1 Tax=Amicula sp. isolate GU52X-4 cfCalB7 TaxID=3003489 RepID=A0A9E8YZM5_9STRA|nr:hypothetical proteine [Amicula sp. isolate GU52X-4 cfCalB7]